MESHNGIESINSVGRKPLIQGSASDYIARSGAVVLVYLSSLTVIEHIQTFAFQNESR